MKATKRLLGKMATGGKGTESKQTTTRDAMVASKSREGERRPTQVPNNSALLVEGNKHNILMGPLGGKEIGRNVFASKCMRGRGKAIKYLRKSEKGNGGEETGHCASCSA